MKKYLIGLFLVGKIAAQTIAQTPPATDKSQGVVHFVRTTYWTKMIKDLPFLSKQEKERSEYMWGSRDGWNSYMLLYFDTNRSHYTYSEEKDPENEGYDWRKETLSYFRNFEKNTMTDWLEQVGRTYVIEDSLEAPNWRVLNELRDIAGHICMKAIVEDTLKKQKIVAWFAQDIPCQMGPERLFGLPGMILGLDINNGTVTIEAKRFEYRNVSKELELPKKMKGKRMSNQAYIQMNADYIKEKIKEEINPYWSLRY
jgi:GLPGLI family protein